MTRPGGPSKLLIGAVFGLLLGCSMPEPPPLPEVITVEGATLVAAGDRGATAARAEIRGNTVSGETVTVHDGATLDIAAKRSDWDLGAGTAVFTGNVVARRRDVELRCDRLEVTIGPAGTIRTATATGNLRLITGSREARASRAELDVPAGTLVLTGSPEIRDGARALTGDRIVVELDGGRAVCEGDPCRLVVPDDTVGAPKAGP